MSHAEVYRDQLLDLKNGYPLFEPDPGSCAHIQVGDVGYIEPGTGHFHRLFNAFFDDSAPINSKHGVPEHFEPLPVELRGTYLRGSLPIGVHSSKKVSTVELNFDVQGAMIPVGAGIQLSCSSERGAVLIIKEPAQRVESEKAKKLGQELLKHYKTWHIFLRHIYGDEIRLREMVFVTGCDLSSDWATATFVDRVTSGKLSFKVCDPLSVSATPAIWGKWESSSSVPVRCGPSAEQRRCHVENESNNNQCLFVRGWRISERIKPFSPTILKAGAEPKDDDPHADGNENMGRTEASLIKVEDSISDDSCLDFNGDEEVNENYQYHTVYDEAFEKLHETFNAGIVLLHDIDIQSYLENRFDSAEIAKPLVWNGDLITSNNGIYKEGSDVDGFDPSLALGIYLHLNDLKNEDHIEIYPSITSNALEIGKTLESGYGLMIALEEPQDQTNDHCHPEAEVGPLALRTNGWPIRRSGSVFSDDDEATVWSISADSTAETLINGSTATYFEENIFLFYEKPGRIGSSTLIDGPGIIYLEDRCFLPWQVQFTKSSHDESVAYVEDENDGNEVSLTSTDGVGQLCQSDDIQYYYQRNVKLIYHRIIASFSSDLILKCIMESYQPSEELLPYHQKSLNDITEEIRQSNGDAIVNGLKMLVQQAQLESPYRCAAALSAIVRLSGVDAIFASFFISVARVASILDLETLAKALHDLHPEKSNFLLLVTIARSTLLSFEDIFRSDHLSYLDYFLTILTSHRSSANEFDDLAVAIVNAMCTLRQAICHRGSSGCQDYHYRYWLSGCHCSSGFPESIYFLAIFITRSLVMLCHQASQVELSLPKVAVLSTLVDLARPLVQFGTSIAYDYSFQHMDLANMALLHGACTMFSKMDSKLHWHAWLFTYFSNHVVQTGMLPRRIASNLTWNSALVGESTSRLSFQRAQRLFTSLKELRREALDCVLMQLCRSHNEESVNRWTEAESLASLHKARQAQVPDNDLTRRFREARDGDDYDWHWYKVECQNQHIWGQLLRSKLDWDWDPSSSLISLFNLTE